MIISMNKIKLIMIYNKNFLLTPIQKCLNIMVYKFNNIINNKSKKEINIYKSIITHKLSIIKIYSIIFLNYTNIKKDNKSQLNSLYPFSLKY